MGGLFSAPKPVIVTANPPPSPAPAAAPATVAAEQIAAEARTESAERARRGLPGTVATSARGVLDPLPAIAGSRKSLLGE